jgi:HEPN domain-containing protein
MVAVRHPYPFLRQGFALRWSGSTDSLLINVSYSGSVEGLSGVEWPRTPVVLAPNVLRSGEQHIEHFVFPVHRDFLRAFEDWRQGRALPLRVNVTAMVYWFGEQGARPAGIPSQEQVHLSLDVGRDQWLGLLAVLGWDEFETFEIPVSVPKQHETLRRGLEHLHAAQAAYRLGHWPTVVMDARKAMEAAASASSDESDRKAKVKALVESIVQGEHNQAKRDTLSSLMLAIRQLRDEAAHGGNLGCQIQREDAELALTVAVSIFRYMGHSLARLEGQRS